jgi:hypothetical protein
MNIIESTKLNNIRIDDKLLQILEPEKIITEEVIFINPLMDERWINFISSHPKAISFHHPDWLRVLKNQYNYHTFAVCVINKINNEIVAGIPFCSVRGFARKWISLPFSDYCPPLYCHEHQLKLITDKLTKCYHEGMVDFIGIGYDLSSSSGFKSIDTAVVHITEIIGGEETMLKIFDRTKKQGINKSVKEGLTASIHRDAAAVNRFYRLHLKTRVKLGVPIQPKKFFRNIFNQFFKNKENGFVIIVTKNNIDLAAGLFVGFNDNLIYKYNASDPDYLHLRPNNLIIWTAIQECIRTKYRYFDFGKSDLDNEGLKKFKAGWGAKESPLAFSYYPNIPTKGLMTKVKSGIVAPLIQHSHPFVCRLLGEVAYKYFPM